MCCEIAISFIFISNFNLIFTLFTITEYNEEKGPPDSSFSLYLTSMLLNHGAYNHSNAGFKRRVKRAGGGSGSGGDKFSKAATMTETKMFQMYLQLFKNLFASSYVGGAHPFHPDVPKPIIQMFKRRIMSFFFPPIGDEAKKV